MPNYVEGGLNNFYGYNNPRVNELATELNQTSDEARQEEILIEVEQNLFADAFGLPLFQHPQITAYNSTYVTDVSNIADRPDGVLQRVGLGGRVVSRRAVTAV